MRIIVTGLIAQHPLGGVTWHYAQYVAGSGAPRTRRLLRRRHGDVALRARRRIDGQRLHRERWRANAKYLSHVMPAIRIAQTGGPTNARSMTGGSAYRTPIGARSSGRPTPAQRLDARLPPRRVSVTFPVSRSSTPTQCSRRSSSCAGRLIFGRRSTRTTFTSVSANRCPRSSRRPATSGVRRDSRCCSPSGDPCSLLATCSRR